MDSSLALDLLKSFGVPLAMLAVVLPYHARVVREKDKEIARVNQEKDKEIARVSEMKDKELARVNDLRVTESQAVTERLIARDGKYLEVFGEVNTTLSLLLDRIK